MGVKRALVCAPLLPEFDRESGSLRVYDAITFLQDAGWAVSFVAENGRDGERYVRHLQQRGVATYCGFGDRTDRLIAAGRFDLAMFAFWHLAERHLPTVRKLSPTTRIVVDMIDLHFMRQARRLFLGAKTETGGRLDERYAADLRRELNTYAAADGVLAVSQKEADLVNDLIGDPALALLAPDAEDLPLSSVPFDERRGILFLGNFRHTPNKEAVEYFLNAVLPRIEARFLDEHPVYIVGNALDDQVRGYCMGRRGVRIIGWVPSVVPYLERTRISVIPLLHGAGTKRKLIQALMIGTPTVSTIVGMEGLHLKDCQHVLQADDPQSFADSVYRLGTDRQLWERLAAKGRTHIEALHGRGVVRSQWRRAIDLVLVREPKPVVEDPAEIEDRGVRRAAVQKRLTGREYRRLRKRIRAAVPRAIPPGAIVMVVSRGDDDLLDLHGRVGWHFPQNAAGIFAGNYPADSEAAIAHLEELRAKGARYLLLPDTASWWLHHYDGFRQHLKKRYRRTLNKEGVCILYDLSGRKGNGEQSGHSHNGSRVL
jgi:glycosyltransferase involved in cell wall biosynthesis